MTWQTILVLKEITEVMGEAPARVFVEMARDPNAEKKRTESRKNKFLALYKNCKEEERELYNQINKRDEADFRSKKLYLYYTQKGRCMYSGERIDLDDLFNDNLYDIDHIYPRHFVKDDSIDNNLVLVKKEINAHKSDGYPLADGIQKKCRVFWNELKSGGFITAEKYERLTRTFEFTEDERVSFINRQLVETRQGTKAITDLFKKTFPQADIVYVKAPNVSAFRQKYKLLKCRNVNDFHHAQDAYLNIVVGNVYHVKFTKNPYNFIREYKKAPEKNPYHMDKIFNYPVVRNDEVAWQTKNDESITMVKSMMKKNTPLVTRRNFEVHGALENKLGIKSAQLAKKANGVGYIGVKTSDARLQNVCRYGGVTDIKGAYFCLVEHTQKKKRIRTIEPVPLYLKHQLDTNEKLEKYFAETYGYENPNVRIEKIKVYSLIKVNGFYMYLTGRTGAQLAVCNAVQMILPWKWMLYVKEMTKAIGAEFTDEYMEKTGTISKLKNRQLYDLLCEKHLNCIYKLRPNPVGENLIIGKDKFNKLSILEQIYVLLQILQLSQLINQGANLELIGLAKKAGTTKISKNISNCNEFKLINQSITGLYENEVDLLTI
jgi:CRISPR-associated endonuclease Csn1